MKEASADGPVSRMQVLFRPNGTAPDITVKDVLVTPEMAKAWLSQNESTQRPLRLALVITYMNDMAQEKWQKNGETIKISASGKLLDGQHRLSAIVRLGAPVRLLVAFGVPEDSFHTIDTGMRRTTAQIVGMSGMQNATHVATAARWIALILEQSASVPKRGAVSPQQILEVIQHHPLIHHFCSRHADKALRTLLPSACSAVFTLAAEKYGQSIVDDFIRAFASGENLTRTDPVYELRERLIGNSSRIAKLQTPTIVAITIKALRAFVCSKSIGVLRWSSNEEWPAI